MAITVTNVRDKVHTELKDIAIPEIGNAGDTSCVNVAYIVSQARLNVADNVEPYRWDNETMYKYVKDVLDEVVTMRSDLNGVTNTLTGSGSNWSITTNVPIRFNQCIVAGVSFRCFANDAEDSQDTERRNYFEKEYMGLLGSVKYRYLNAMIDGFIEDGVSEITDGRPDVLLKTYASGNVALPDYLLQSIVDYVVSRCLTVTMESNIDVKKQQLYYYERYKSETYGGARK